MGNVLYKQETCVQDEVQVQKEILPPTYEEACKTYEFETVSIYGNLSYFENGFSIDLPGPKCICGLACNKCKYVVNRRPLCTNCFSNFIKDKIISYY